MFISQCSSFDLKKCPKRPNQPIYLLFDKKRGAEMRAKTAFSARPEGLFFGKIAFLSVKK